MKTRTSKTKTAPKVYDARQHVARETRGVLGDRMRADFIRKCDRFTTEAALDVARLKTRIDESPFDAFNWNSTAAMEAAAMLKVLREVFQVIEYCDQQHDGYQGEDNLAIMRRVYRGLIDEVMRGACYGRDGMERLCMAARAKIADALRFSIEWADAALGERTI